MQTEETLIALPSEDKVDAGAKTANEILRQFGYDERSDSSLPALHVNKPFEDWSQKIQRWMEHLYNWLFPNPSAREFNPEKLKNILFWGGLLALAVAAGLLAYWLLKRFTAKGVRSRAEASNPLASFSSPETKILAEIERALTAKQFSRAARLRWRLFLLRQTRPPQTTPREFFGAVDLASEQYRVMFGETSPSPTDYETCDEALTRIEADRPAANGSPS